MMTLLVFTLFLSLYLSVSNGELFTSATRFMKAVETSDTVLQEIDSFIQKKEAQLSFLEEYSRQLTVCQIERNLNGSNNFIRNMDVETMEQQKLSNTDEDIDNLQSLINSHLPSKTDLTGLATSLALLQNTFNITSREMASGRIKNQTLGSLSVEECQQIAESLSTALQFRLAIDWFEIALDKLMNDTVHKDMDEEYTVDLKTKIKRGLRMSKSRNKILKMASEFNPEMQPHTENGSASNQYYGLDASRNISHEMLCNRGYDYGKDGFCLYYTLEEFYLRKFKIEFINESPYVVVIYDIVEQKLMYYLRRNWEMLTRSHVVGRDGAGNQLSTARTSQSVVPIETRRLKYLYRTIERLTGLRINSDTSETIQVLNYGIGGEYKPHHDWFSDEKYIRDHVKGKQRIATVIFYLSDVQIGGSTIFPEIGIGLPPEKGAALIFTNLDEEGNNDKRNLHGGCPVCLGSKWIANKWIHNNQDIYFRNTKPSIWNTIKSLKHNNNKDN